MKIEEKVIYDINCKYEILNTAHYLSFFKNSEEIGSVLVEVIDKDRLFLYLLTIEKEYRNTKVIHAMLSFANDIYNKYFDGYSIEYELANKRLHKLIDRKVKANKIPANLIELQSEYFMSDAYSEMRDKAVVEVQEYENKRILNKKIAELEQRYFANVGL
ncbi:hypothetical protein [Heyndrickxia oleronia]|jgi:hypothetical protein|uniref:hypothetical protein n=1 Tax=Heyndrickxia oleronia TaxID=38875 RepID=UPI00242BAE0F|nr:hypothetical protein [Heyndrickxia oleronia]MCI1590391.1 hypothetical protein [Heyndrickxia oleronia]MCI1611347.1 hypothetical protein [Heyndrickxia oleronia]MCI1742790.1 hypothetical protein [Heyndrickxia oleronia]MCI1763125.1 hypothetical protein [Heyndrickxia oleronia]